MMALLTAISSCNGNSDKNTEYTDTIDSAAIAVNDSDSVLSLTGVAIDGAMNSIFIKSANGDTVDFEYPDLDPKMTDSWDEGDTVTVRYIKAKVTDAPDSVLQLINNSKGSK